MHLKISTCCSFDFQSRTTSFLGNMGVSSWCNGWSGGLWNRSEWVRTPVMLLRLLSGKYSYERYEPPYPPSYGLNSTTTVLGEWLWHEITYKGWYAIKQRNQTKPNLGNMKWTSKPLCVAITDSTVWNVLTVIAHCTLVQAMIMTVHI